RLPQKGTGHVPRGVPSQLCVVAILATTGAAPVPVPAPRPATKSTGSVQRVAIASAASSAARSPITGLAAAPSPCSLIGNFLSAAHCSNSRQSVLIAAKGSPSVLIMRPAAHPMAIITSHLLVCCCSLLHGPDRVGAALRYSLALRRHAALS